MTNFENARALIIEDAESDADVLANLLAHLGVVYTVFLGSDDAINGFGNIDVPDVIFLDLEMSGPNGYEVLEALKGEVAMQNVPIVAYTSHLSEMANAREAGFHSFLGKPLRRADFGNQLASIFNNVPVWDAR